MGWAAMWFKVLSFVIAAALLSKAIVALTIPTRFYATRQQHYAEDSMPAALMVPPAVILSITTIAWYATLVHYRPWGWIVTGSLTVLCCLSLQQLVRWRAHRRVMGAIVANPKVWLIDCALLLVGLGFAALGVLVY